MHHKQLLSGSFRSGARRSPCLQTPLCPSRLLGPEHADPWESQHLCSSPAGGAGCGGRDHRPSPRLAAPPAPPAHREQRAERKGACVCIRSRKSKDKAEGDPTPLGRRPLSPESRTRALARTTPRPSSTPGAVRTPRPVLRRRDPGSREAPARRSKPFEGRELWVWGGEW